MRANFNKVSRWFKRKHIPQKTMDSQMQKITRCLINGSIGSKGVMTQAFREEIEKYSADENPIGEEEARNLLVNMVKLAVAERSKLEGTIVDQVERGLLYSDYYRDVEEVTDMAIKTDEYYRKAEMVREDYLVEYGFYARNRMESFRDGKTKPLSDNDLDELKKRIDKINRLTGFGGEAE